MTAKGPTHAQPRSSSRSTKNKKPASLLTEITPPALREGGSARGKSGTANNKGGKSKGGASVETALVDRSVPSTATSSFDNTAAKAAGNVPETPPFDVNEYENPEKPWLDYQAVWSVIDYGQKKKSDAVIATTFRKYVQAENKQGWDGWAWHVKALDRRPLPHHHNAFRVRLTAHVAGAKEPKFEIDWPCSIDDNEDEDPDEMYQLALNKLISWQKTHAKKSIVLNLDMDFFVQAMPASHKRMPVPSRSPSNYIRNTGYPTGDVLGTERHQKLMRQAVLAEPSKQPATTSSKPRANNQNAKQLEAAEGIIGELHNVKEYAVDWKAELACLQNACPNNKVAGGGVCFRNREKVDNADGHYPVSKSALTMLCELLKEGKCTLDSIVPSLEFVEMVIRQKYQKDAAGRAPKAAIDSKGSPTKKSQPIIVNNFGDELATALRGLSGSGTIKGTPSRISRSRLPAPGLPADYSSVVVVPKGLGSPRALVVEFFAWASQQPLFDEDVDDKAQLDLAADVCTSGGFDLTSIANMTRAEWIEEGLQVGMRFRIREAVRLFLDHKASNDVADAEAPETG